MISKIYINILKAKKVIHGQRSEKSVSHEYLAAYCIFPVKPAVCFRTTPEREIASQVHSKLTMYADDTAPINGWMNDWLTEKVNSNKTEPNILRTNRLETPNKIPSREIWQDTEPEPKHNLYENKSPATMSRTIPTFRIELNHGLSIKISYWLP